eukprot:1537148-Prymnesium_polylepis.1
MLKRMCTLSRATVQGEWAMAKAMAAGRWHQRVSSEAERAVAAFAFVSCVAWICVLQRGLQGIESPRGPPRGAGRGL